LDTTRRDGSEHTQTPGFEAGLSGHQRAGPSHPLRKNAAQ